MFQTYVFIILCSYNLTCFYMDYESELTYMIYTIYLTKLRQSGHTFLVERSKWIKPKEDAHSVTTQAYKMNFIFSYVV